MDLYFRVQYTEPQFRCLFGCLGVRERLRLRLCPEIRLACAPPKGLFVHCRTSPCISPLSPVPTPKTPVSPSSQPKGLLVHCRPSPCISPLSPVPTPKTPVPPSSQPKGLLVHCRTSPCISPLSPVPIPKTPVPPSSQPKWLFVEMYTVDLGRK